MSRAPSPFRPATVLALLSVGAAAFLLLLYAMGAGWDGRDERDGGAHAASPGLNGFAALAGLLEAQGYAVSLSRNAANLEDNALLVLTPGQFANVEHLAGIIAERRQIGPTLLILPKWQASLLPDDPRIDAREGWVSLGEAWSPEWLPQIAGLEDAELATGATSSWRGFGLTGALPDPAAVQAVREGSAKNLYPLVVDGEGDMLAAWRHDNGYYPVLAEASGERFFADPPEGIDEDAWPLVVVIEPDLLNNYAMADRRRAGLGLALVEASLEGYDLPIVFDLTIPGLGRSRNLLTLAFAPPFLAATLTLLLAALLIGWRALRRFGAPRAELPELAHGKAQLARNGAGLVERTGRLHLLGAPFAAMVAARLAALLGIREADPVAREAAIDRALAARGHEPQTFSAPAGALRRARRPAELLRAAAALSSIERTL